MIIINQIYVAYDKTIPKRDYFVLHAHQNYELYFFISGDCEYVVEGAVYPLEPYDLLFIRPGEMHRVFHKSNEIYERIVINIDEDFFHYMNCDEYLDIFNNRQSGTYNKIPSSVVRKLGVWDCYERLKKYSANKNLPVSPVVKAVIMEILHLMNLSETKNSPTTNRIQEIISYINIHFCENITLNLISNLFFISPAHLSREFHSATGHTLKSYITKKRLIHVVNDVQGGNSLINSALNAGFGDYTSFYRMFCKEYGISPKKFFNKS